MILIKLIDEQNKMEEINVKMNYRSNKRIILINTIDIITIMAMMVT